MTYLPLLIVLGIFYAVFNSFCNMFAELCWGRNGKSRVCTTCGHHGPSKIVTRGSILIEIVLWMCFIIPGLIYSIWRVTSRTQACRACGATTLVPADSPVGRKLLV